MQFTESISMALGSIRGNKLRAGLTLLSIAIGVFAIVGVGASVRVLDAKVTDQLDDMGRNSFFIQRDPALVFTGRAYWRRKDITVRQGLEYKRQLQSAEAVGLMNMAMGAIAKHGSEESNPNLFLYGGDETFLSNGDYALAEGRSIDAGDVQLASDVAVIGADVATKLYKGLSAIGRDIKINNRRYLVVGVLDAKGSAFGMSQDNFILIPITSATKYFIDEWSSSINITVRSNSLDDLEETVDQATGLMRVIRKVE